MNTHVLLYFTRYRIACILEHTLYLTNTIHTITHISHNDSDMYYINNKTYAQFACTLFIVQYVTYIERVLHEVYSIRRTLYDVQYVTYIVRCIVCDVHCTRTTHIVLHTTYTILCILYDVHCKTLTTGTQIKVY